VIYTKLTQKAINIAYEAHKNQKDKFGIPYIFHPMHVAEMMDTEIECVVAILHDVVEDTPITFKELEKEFSSDIIEALKLLTRDKNRDYMDYIKAIKNNYLATKVKLADLRHNMDETRLKKITKKDVARNEKYKIAMEYLKR